MDDKGVSATSVVRAVRLGIDIDGFAASCPNEDPFLVVTGDEVDGGSHSTGDSKGDLDSVLVCSRDCVEGEGSSSCETADGFLNTRQFGLASKKLSSSDLVLSLWLPRSSVVISGELDDIPSSSLDSGVDTTLVGASEIVDMLWPSTSTTRDSWYGTTAVVLTAAKSSSSDEMLVAVGGGVS